VEHRLYVFGVNGLKFQISSFYTQKRNTLAKTTYNDVLCVAVCPKDVNFGRVEGAKKMDRNVHASDWLFPRPTTSI